jgi:hypothetical protein
MDWQIRLITLFEYVSEKHETHLCSYCQRMSNNFSPKFTDTEAITVFLFGILQNRFKIKEIYKYTKDHLSEWFPDMPSYTAFVQRLNRMEDVFPVLTECIVNDFSGTGLMRNIRLIDSIPVIMAGAKRSSSAKVAPQAAAKGYCSSKGMWYYGVKLHVLALRRDGHLPVPAYMRMTPAKDHDLNAFREITSLLYGGEVYADKAYIDTVEKELMAANGAAVHTPVKKKKGQTALYLFDQLLSTSVSRVRQPIESFFSWLNEKTGIENASKVRSFNGLKIHVYGKFAAGIFLLLFNS